MGKKKRGKSRDGQASHGDEEPVPSASENPVTTSVAETSSASEKRTEDQQENVAKKQKKEATPDIQGEKEMPKEQEAAAEGAKKKQKKKKEATPDIQGEKEMPIEQEAAAEGAKKKQKKKKKATPDIQGEKEMPKEQEAAKKEQKQKKKAAAGDATAAPSKKPTPSGASAPPPAEAIRLQKHAERNACYPPRRTAKTFCGTAGRPIKITTNLFPVSVANKDITVYHYDVVIKDHRDSEILPRRKKMDVFEQMKRSFPRVFDAPIAYDSNKNAYSAKLFPQLVAKKATKPTIYEVEVQFEGAKNKSKFKVTLVNVAAAQLRDLLDSLKYSPIRKDDLPTSTLQMVEVMFRHYRSIKYELVGGRNFFSLDGEGFLAKPLDLGGGKQGMSGFFGSMRPSAWKDGSILLNINLAHTAFYKAQSMIDFIKEHPEIRIFDFARTIDPSMARRIDKLIRGLKIRVTHAPRTYKFLRLLPQGSDKTSFDLTTDKGTQKKTVQEYMRIQYGIDLKYPQLNCVHVGSPEKSIYIPMELCNIAKGQRVMKKLSDRETATFIRSTAIPPHDRLRSINNIVRSNNFNQDPMLKALSFTISDTPIRTDGRVLPPPGLLMDRGFEPFQGEWDVRDKKFYRPASLQKWAVINYDPRTPMPVVQKFVSMLVRMANEKGMKMNKPLDIHQFKGREPNPLEDFRRYQKDEVQLIMCVLPGRRYYGAIKKAGDTQTKIITQCVQGMNVDKCQPQTVGNIILKINAKMDGINNVVALKNNLPIVSFPGEPRARFIIMGADVNHPPAGGDKAIPSIAAVTGSFDQFATRYATERRAQYHRVEIIQDMTEITVNLLKNFYRNTRSKPSRIVMYRDGVSESQFMEVLSSEMFAMRDACNKLEAGYQPGITFICVQKRHHTRLFCDERDGVGKSKNIPPGTIVDKDITHPHEIDFYLSSHKGIQGTSRPAHYHVLWDDNDLQLDELQQLTYRLCHVYSRCSKSVSIPAPVYYAHLAAFRAKVYVGEFLDESDFGSTYSGGKETDLAKLQTEIKMATNIMSHDTLGSKLHYI